MQRKEFKEVIRLVPPTTQLHPPIIIKDSNGWEARAATLQELVDGVTNKPHRQAHAILNLIEQLANIHSGWQSLKATLLADSAEYRTHLTKLEQERNSATDAANKWEAKYNNAAALHADLKKQNAASVNKAASQKDKAEQYKRRKDKYRKQCKDLGDKLDRAKDALKKQPRVIKLDSESSDEEVTRRPLSHSRQDPYYQAPRQTTKSPIPPGQTLNNAIRFANAPSAAHSTRTSHRPPTHAPRSQVTNSPGFFKADGIPRVNNFPYRPKSNPKFPTPPKFDSSRTKYKQFKARIEAKFMRSWEDFPNKQAKIKFVLYHIENTTAYNIIAYRAEPTSIEPYEDIDKIQTDLKQAYGNQSLELEISIEILNPKNKQGKNKSFSNFYSRFLKILGPIRNIYPPALVVRDILKLIRKNLVVKINIGTIPAIYTELSRLFYQIKAQNKLFLSNNKYEYSVKSRGGFQSRKRVTFASNSTANVATIS